MISVIEYFDQTTRPQRGEHRFHCVVVVASASRVTYFERPKAARVAQLDRVTASEAAGCGFNSPHAHHFIRIGAAASFRGEGRWLREFAASFERFVDVAAEVF